jgi:hypothetical protein
MSAAVTIGLTRLLARFSPSRDPAAGRPGPWWRFALADLLVLILFLGTWLGLTAQQVPVPVPVWYHLLLPLFVALVAMPLAILTVCTYHAVIGPWRVAMGIAMLTVIWISALVLRARNAPLYLDHGPSSLSAWSGVETFWIVVEGAMPLVFAACLAVPLLILRLARKLNEPIRRQVVLIATAGAIVIGLLTILLMWDDIGRISQQMMLWRVTEVGIHSISLVAVASFIALVTWLCSVGCRAPAGWKPRLAQCSLIALALAAGVPGAWIYWQMLWYAPFPQVKAGRENQYDRLVAIAKHMAAFRGMGQPSGISAELDEAVLLLRNHNQVPQHVIEARWNSESALNGGDAVVLTTRLEVAARGVTRASLFDQTADYAVAIIRFDAMAAQGEQSHFAYRGYDLLSEYRRDFSNAKARDVIQLLRQTLTERNDIDFLIACYRAQSERDGRWHSKLRSALARLVGNTFDDGTWAQADRIRETRKSWDAWNLLMQTDLAIGLFQSDHRRLPESLAELVPEYLPEVPVDPHSGGALVYRPVGDGYELYSVGSNGTDESDKAPSYVRSPGAAGDDIRLRPPRTGR